jgi:hypothetical protein
MRRRALWTALSAVLFGAMAPIPVDARQEGFDLSALEIPDGFLELSDLTIYGPRPTTQAWIASRETACSKRSWPVSST